MLAVIQRYHPEVLNSKHQDYWKRYKQITVLKRKGKLVLP
jgi:hypothetical protein